MILGACKVKYFTAHIKVYMSFINMSTVFLVIILFLKNINLESMVFIKENSEVE